MGDEERSSADIEAGLAAIRDRYQDNAAQQVKLVEDAVVAALEGRLEPDGRREAERAAHKLAGSAGTFGFPAASAFAREIEGTLTGHEALTHGQAFRLAGLVNDLAASLVGAPEPSAPAAAPPAPLPVRPEPPSPPWRAIKVLAVDDDPAILEAITVTLDGGGIETITLSDPTEVVSSLGACVPDLLLLDVDMPGTSGIEICQSLRDGQRWSSLPILFLTARRDEKMVAAMFAAGADDYLIKPLVGFELRARIFHAAERRRLYVDLLEKDQLTGVSNRRHSAEIISSLVAQASVSAPVALSLIDVDGLRHVNNAFGHPAGDDALAFIAQRLEQAVNEADVIGRWAGEEFVVCMKDADADGAVQALASVLDSVRTDGRFVAHEQPRLSFTAGVAEAPRDGASLESLYRACALALSAGKTAGGDRISRYAGSDAVDERYTTDVLVVEDDVPLAAILVSSLNTRSLSTVWLKDGKEAADALTTADSAIRPRLLLLDVDLPSLDGLGVLRRVAEAGLLSELQVIMLTARAAELEVLKALELGAHDHVAKPFSIPVLMQKVHRTLGS
ncbi:MAG: response regulator [Actinomycetota bacterium]